MAVEVKIKGMDELRKKLKGLPAKLAKNILRSAMREAAAHLREAVKAKTPVRTGKLRKSIKSRESRGKNKQEFAAKVFATKFYAHFVEYGTKHSPAQPFMRPAFDAEKDKIVEVLRKKIQDRLAQEAVKSGAI